MATYSGTGGNLRPEYADVLTFHEYAAGEQYNGIFTDFPNKAVFVEAGAGAPRSEDLLGTNLKIENNIWWKEAGLGWYDICDQMFLVDTLTNNQNNITDPLIKGISRTNDNGLDPRPDATGPAATLDRKTYPTGFQQVDYMGAFDPNEENTWLHGWTALDQNDILKSAQSIEEIVSKPGTPTGDSDIIEDTNHEYSTTGAESNLGNMIEYSFNWGDGSKSAWSEDKTAEHAWDNPGNYGIFVVARSQEDTTATNTSDTLGITVNEQTAVEDPEHQPTEYRLDQNYPNPFNPATTISYELKRPGHVNISIYNLKGQKVSTVIDAEQGPGKHEIKWDGSELSSGIYMYVIKSGDFTQSKKMLLMK